MSEALSTLLSYGGKLTREQLALVPTPPATATHRPVPHAEVIEALVETLGFRHIGVVKDEYAVSKDGMKMFGVLDLDTGMHGCRFSIGVRNAHDKTMRLAMTVGYRVFVCENMAFSGDFRAGAGQALQELLAAERALDRRGPDAAQFRPHAQAGGSLAGIPALRRAGQAHHLPGVHRIRPGGAQAPGPAGPRSLFQSAARRVPAADDVEPVQRLHVGVQGTRSDPAVPGDRQARRVSGSRTAAGSGGLISNPMGAIHVYAVGQVVSTPGALDALAGAGQDGWGFSTAIYPAIGATWTRKTAAKTNCPSGGLPSLLGL